MAGGSPSKKGNVGNLSVEDLTKMVTEAAVKAAQELMTSDMMKNAVTDIVKATVQGYLNQIEGLLCRITQLQTELDTFKSQTMNEVFMLKAQVASMPVHSEPLLHEDKLIAMVPEEHVDSVKQIIDRTIQEERPGDDYRFSVKARAPKEGKRRNGEPWKRLVDIRVDKYDRKAIATLGGVLYRKYGIAIMDALTRRGRDVRQERAATFVKLKDVDKLNPKWVRGAEITVEVNGRRQLYQGPWVGQEAHTAAASAAQTAPPPSAAGQTVPDATMA